MKFTARAALFLGCFASASSAYAQCSGVAVGANQQGGQLYTAGDLVPFGTGAAISSIISTVGTVNMSSLAQSSAYYSPPDTQKRDFMGGGVWVREVGGATDSKSKSTTNSFGDLGERSTENCAIKTKTEFIGTQIGFDIARANFGGGSNLAIGLTTGFFRVESKDRTPGQSTFHSEFDVPFAGVYMAYKQGGLSVDGQFRVDAYRGNITDYRKTDFTTADFKNGALYGQQLTASAATFLANIAYTIDLGNRLYIEPSIGGVMSFANVDRFQTTGNYVVDGLGLSPPGGVKIHEIDSMLGRASVRMIKSYDTNGYTLSPFVMGSIYREFAGAVKASANGNYNALGFGDAPTSGNIATSRVGTFGHVGMGISAAAIGSGWLGYLRGDYRFGENVEGWSINAGLRYNFNPPRTDVGDDRARRPVDLANFNWTGLYVGGFGGGLFGRSDVSNSNGVAKPDPAGGQIGGQIGYNYQMQNTVVGVEAEWSYSNADGSRGCPGNVDVTGFGGIGDRRNFFQCHTSIDQMGIVAGRVGQVWDRALVYLKGGLAIGDVDVRSKFNMANAPKWFNPDPVNNSGGQKQVMIGWALGMGLEYALSSNWTAKAEYMHFDLGSENFRADDGKVANAKVYGDSVRVGLNYMIGK